MVSNRIKYWGAFVVGILWGAIITFIAVFLWMRHSLVTEVKCKNSFEDTLNAISRKGGELKGWSVRAENCALPQTTDQCKMRVLRLCNALYAIEMLNDPASRKISSVIPCTFAIYEKPDGRTYLARWNAGLLGFIMGGVPSTVFNLKVKPDQDFLLSGIIDK